MLLLTRRPGEQICIGEGIVITFLGNKGNQARIGVEAPLHVPVNRKEISDRIKREHTSECVWWYTVPNDHLYIEQPQKCPCHGGAQT